MNLTPLVIGFYMGMWIGMVITLIGYAVMYCLAYLVERMYYVVKAKFRFAEPESFIGLMDDDD